MSKARRNRPTAREQSPAKVDPEKISEALQAIPPDQRQQMLAQFVSYQGPLPDPQSIVQYEQVLPGSAERIFANFENQSKHRQQLEVKVIDNGMEIETRGQWFAFILGLSAILAGSILTLSGYGAVGAVIFGSTIAGLVTTFITGKYMNFRDKSREG